MLEYIITGVFILLWVKPVTSTLYVQVAELVAIIYVTYKTPMLGIICAAIMIQQMPIEGMKVVPGKRTRIDVDHQIRPKDSTQIRVHKHEGSPLPSKPYSDKKSVHYSPF